MPLECARDRGEDEDEEMAELPEPGPELPSSPHAFDYVPYTPSNNRARSALLRGRPAPSVGAPSSPRGLSSSIFSYSSPSLRPRAAQQEAMTHTATATTTAPAPATTAAIARPQVERLLQERAANLAIEQEVLGAFANSVDAVAKQYTTGYALKVAKKLTEAYIVACLSALSLEAPTTVTANAPLSPPSITYASTTRGGNNNSSSSSRRRLTLKIFESSLGLIRTLPPGIRPRSPYGHTSASC